MDIIAEVSDKALKKREANKKRKRRQRVKEQEDVALGSKRRGDDRERRKIRAQKDPALAKEQKKAAALRMKENRRKQKLQIQGDGFRYFQSSNGVHTFQPLLKLVNDFENTHNDGVDKIPNRLGSDMRYETRLYSCRNDGGTTPSSAKTATMHLSDSQTKSLICKIERDIVDQLGWSQFEGNKNEIYISELVLTRGGTKRQPWHTTSGGASGGGGLSQDDDQLVSPSSCGPGLLVYALCGRCRLHLQGGRHSGAVVEGGNNNDEQGKNDYTATINPGNGLFVSGWKSHAGAIHEDRTKKRRSTCVHASRLLVFLNNVEKQGIPKLVSQPGSDEAKV